VHNFSVRQTALASRYGGPVAEKRKPQDVNQLAKAIKDKATEEHPEPHPSRVHSLFSLSHGPGQLGGIGF
jgi:hypothetical protein